MMFRGPNQHLFEPYHKAPKSRMTCKKCHVIAFVDKKSLRKEFKRLERIANPIFRDGIHESIIDGEEMYTVFKKDESKRYPIFCTMTNEEFFMTKACQ